MSNITKWTTSRTNVTQYHKGGGTATKTFSNVGATRFLANRMQVIVSQYLFNLLKACGVWYFHAYPFWFTHAGLWDDFNWNARCFAASISLTPAIFFPATG
jgi:hypothetical protein